MRNRAKCKLCDTTIESFCLGDVIYCECREIGVDGGMQYYRAIYKNKENFLRIDDDDRIIYPKFVEPSEVINGVESDIIKKWAYKERLDDDLSPKTEELLDSLDHMIENIEKLPELAKSFSISHYDFCAFLKLFRAILRSEDS